IFCKTLYRTDAVHNSNYWRRIFDSYSDDNKHYLGNVFPLDSVEFCAMSEGSKETGIIGVAKLII
ncbi:hypothetical protein Bhyg_04607, partial [Pseudolycoriella hygida]